jgi:putative membrane protein
MKPSIQWLASLAAAATLSACSGNSDSVENAQKVNEARNEARLPEAAEAKADYDSEFMTKAASGGMLEVELGKLVLQRATTAEARQFAQHMITQHSAANAELKALAQRKHITLPTMMGNDQQDVFKDIEEKKGLPFDREYLHEMQQDHEEDIKLFTEAAAKAADSEVRAFATRSLPMLQKHLAMVNKLEPMVKSRR